MKLSKYAIALTLAVLSTSIAGTAHAEGLTASLSKNTDISRDGEAVTLNISGVPSGQGVYILQCVTPTVSGERPTVCVGQNKTIWASTISTPGAQPLTPTMNLTIERQFVSGANTIDCSVSSCGIFVRRDHNGPSDKSLDTFLTISFVPEYSVQVSKTEAITYSGESLKVNIVGLTGTQGIYVRLCKAAAESERPTLCDGLGVWASMSSAQQAYGAVNAANELTLPVKASFVSGETAIDCQKSVCVVFVRRDHNAGSDLSLDRVIPVTFTSPPVLAISAKASKSGNSFVFVIKNAKSKSVQVTVGTVVKTIKPTSDNYTFKVLVSKNKGKNTALKVTYGTKVLVKTTLKG
jgi:hypothetical protein